MFKIRIRSDAALGEFGEFGDDIEQFLR